MNLTRALLRAVPVRRLAGLFALLLLLVAPLTHAAPETHRFYGYAFDENSGKYLYTEVHQHHYEGDKWLGGSIRYYDSENRLIGEKSLDFSHDPFIPVFRMRMPRENYEEGISAVTPGGIEMERQTDGRKERDRVDRLAGMVADSGFHSFVVSHLDDLEAGKVMQFPFVVAGRLAVYKFRVSKTGNGTLDGHPTIKLKAEADSLLRFVAPTLTMSYDLQSHYLIEYRGVSNIHDPATGKAYSAVRIVYPSKPPAGAPAVLPAPLPDAS